jgi:hypothetical protein
MVSNRFIIKTKWVDCVKELLPCCFLDAAQTPGIWSVIKFLYGDYGKVLGGVMWEVKVEADWVGFVKADGGEMVSDTIANGSSRFTDVLFMAVKTGDKIDEIRRGTVKRLGYTESATVSSAGE